MLEKFCDAWSAEQTYRHHCRPDACRIQLDQWGKWLGEEPVTLQELKDILGTIRRQLDDGAVAKSEPGQAVHAGRTGFAAAAM